MLRAVRCAAIAVSLVSHLAAQGQEAPPITVDVRLVVLHATVTGSRGLPVSGLQSEDFRVYEDGRPQTIRLFQHEDVPVAAGLVVDASSSMKRKRAEVAAAAVAFARASNPADQMFVINFNENVTFGLPSQQMFSSSPMELEQALKDAPARGKTALYDAIDAGLERLRQTTRKKALVVVSDGGDNASIHTLHDVQEKAAASDVIIYTIGVFDEYDSDSNPGVLKKLAHVTGGEAFFPRELSSIVGICERIAKDIRSQYTIGYTPSDSNLKGRYRTVRVVASHKGEKWNVRTRTGYLATETMDK